MLSLSDAPPCRSCCADVGLGSASRESSSSVSPTSSTFIPTHLTADCRALCPRSLHFSLVSLSCMSLLLQRLGVRLPLIQAPMAGVSTPALAAAVSNAGALGSIGIGAASLSDARLMVRQTRALTGHAFAVNVFCHETPMPDPAAEAAWLNHLRDEFLRFDAEPPTELRTIYKSFRDDHETATMLMEEQVPAISFHFGLPVQPIIDKLKRAGPLLFATVTNVQEARTAVSAGIDVLVAQGFEAGGHRGVFNPNEKDPKLGTAALLRCLQNNEIWLPIVAAGGIMDGKQVAAALEQGAIAAQLGTAFVPCPESAADDAYRAALANGSETAMVTAVSGRPARTLINRWTERVIPRLRGGRLHPPGYPIAYDAGKALHAAAKAHGEGGYGAQWAGEGAAAARAMPAADLVALLARELAEARTAL